MCGIAIVKKEEIEEVLENQIDRGLDWIWFMVSDWKWQKYLEWSIYAYNKIIKRVNNWLAKTNMSDDFVMFHHRKASIGKINIDNSHPFIGENFDLMQNGTSKKFFNKYKDVIYLDIDGNDMPKASTDSENLLRFIETRTNKLNEIPKVLEELDKELGGEKFGCLMIRDRYGNFLFYSDGERETNIEIKWDKLVRITNYPLKGYRGWKNKGWLISSFKWEIQENTFKNLNTESFYTYKPTVKTTTINNGYVRKAVQATVSKTPSTESYKITTSWEHWTKYEHLTDCYVKDVSYFNEDETMEFWHSSDFFFSNITTIYPLSYREALNLYLQNSYWVNNKFDFWETFWYNIPEHGIARAYVDLHSFDESEVNDYREMSQDEIDIDNLHKGYVRSA